MKTPISKMLDLDSVKRWTMVNTAASSTVASHSFNVAVIGMAIWTNLHVKVGYSERDVCYHAIMHDRVEAYSGDIATPVKRAMREAGFDANGSTYGAPEEVGPTEHICALLKIADKIENWNFIRQYGVGDRARVAERYCQTDLHDALNSADEDLQQAAKKVLIEILRREPKF